MKTVLLIGLGRFGKHIAMKMNELHHQVMAVDNNEERVEALLPFVTNAQIGDSTNEEFLKSLGVRNFDLCFLRAFGSCRDVVCGRTIYRTFCDGYTGHSTWKRIYARLCMGLCTGRNSFLLQWIFLCLWIVILFFPAQFHIYRMRKDSTCLSGIQVLQRHTSANGACNRNRFACVGDHLCYCIHLDAKKVEI